MAAWARQRLQEQQWRDSNPQSDAPVAVDAIGGALDTMAKPSLVQQQHHGSLEIKRCSSLRLQ
jgi:hypothetical protein